MPKADVHPFDKWIFTVRPNEMTFPWDYIVYQPYATIDIVGTCTRPGATLYFEVYRAYNGSAVMISSSNQKSDISSGFFSWRSSYDASGDYAIKVWATETCKIAGNLVY